MSSVFLQIKLWSDVNSRLATWPRRVTGSAACALNMVRNQQAITTNSLKDAREVFTTSTLTKEVKLGCPTGHYDGQLDRAASRSPTDSLHQFIEITHFAKNSQNS